jgi:hypothetical protein
MPTPGEHKTGRSGGTAVNTDFIPFAREVEP